MRNFLILCNPMLSDVYVCMVFTEEQPLLLVPSKKLNSGYEHLVRDEHPEHGRQRHRIDDDSALCF